MTSRLFLMIQSQILNYFFCHILRIDTIFIGPSSSNSSTNVNMVIPSNEECGIRDVWNHNLREEFRAIRNIVQKYPYVAMVR